MCNYFDEASGIRDCSFRRCDLQDDADAQAEHSKADEEVEIIENSPTVKVMGMEMTASCEGKGSRPTTPIIPVPPR